MIHLLFTGGTISMQHDPAAGGNVPAHDGEQLVERVPGLERISPFRVENWARVPAAHLGPERARPCPNPPLASPLARHAR